MIKALAILSIILATIPVHCGCDIASITCRAGVNLPPEPSYTLNITVHKWDWERPGEAEKYWENFNSGDNWKNYYLSAAIIIETIRMPDGSIIEVNCELPLEFRTTGTYGIEFIIDSDTMNPYRTAYMTFTVKCQCADDVEISQTTGCYL